MYSEEWEIGTETHLQLVCERHAKKAEESSVENKNSLGSCRQNRAPASSVLRKEFAVGRCEEDDLPRDN